MKKSIILLVTIFFITAISALILQNLKDTDIFLKHLSSSRSLLQMQISIQNIKKQLPNFFDTLKKRYGDKLYAYIEDGVVLPFQVGDVEFILDIKSIKKNQQFIKKIECKTNIKINNLNSNLLFILDETSKNKKEKFRIINIFVDNK
jgi:hypothetical protein